MGIEFTAQESSVLYRLLAEHTSDIILKTDRAGFIRHASPSIAQLGLLPDMLIWPQLFDIVDRVSAPLIRAAHKAALTGREAGDWIEFAAANGECGPKCFAIRMRSLADARGRPYGVLSVLRSIEEKRSLEEQLFNAEMTDPLTGLTNRKAFLAMLGHLIGRRQGGCFALFDIDHFRAFNMRYGQLTGDRLLIAFADFLRNLARSRDILSRVGGESFGILLPESGLEEARAACSRIIETLAELGRASGPDEFPITASAGLVPIGRTLDATLRNAELAVFFAKARGRNCLEVGPEKYSPVRP